MKLQGLFKKFLLVISTIISVLGFGFPLCIIIDEIQTKLILKDEYIMTGMGTVFFLIIIPISIITILLTYAVSKVIKYEKDLSENSDMARSMIKRWYVILPAAVLITAIITINFTAVKENEIVKYSLLHLNGKSYRLSETDKIEAGFDRNGEFFYNVTIDEEEFKLVFNAGTTAEIFQDKSYSEYQYIDKKIFKLCPDVEKKTSMKNMDKYGYGEESLEVIKEIINYKGE